MEEKNHELDDSAAKTKGAIALTDMLSAIYGRQQELPIGERLLLKEIN